MEVLIVGAGLSGAVVARQLAEAGLRSHIVDARDHVAGNCYTQRDGETGVMVHVYGPHIFHTDDETVWQFVTRFADFVPYEHRVKATARGRVWSLPVNLFTLNQVYDRALRPTEARAFIGQQTVGDATEPVTFEDQAMRFVGREIYELLFSGYTQKQWGRSPKSLPASILKRLPVRFNYDDRYFSHRHQALPRHGYTAMVMNILDHPNIRVSLSQVVAREDTTGYDHVFWTGSIDGYFGWDCGRLAYRTLDFERAVVDGDWQGIPVMNYPDLSVAHTRITEHKHLAPWEQHDRSVIYTEFSRECTVDDVPYYPVRLVDEKALLGVYVQRALDLDKTTFLGRLGTYRYIDMDVCIAEAIACSEEFVASLRKKSRRPVFSVPPS